MRGTVGHGLVVIAAMAALLTAGAGAAQAKTLTVDDDRAQCAGAGHTTIQAAVDAAAVNDTIQVCRGTYTEQIRIPAAKRGLKLRGNDSAPPRIVGPASRAAYPASSSVAVLETRAPAVQIRGFQVSGEVADEFCTDVAAIGVFGGSALIDFVKLGPVQTLCGGRGVGVRVATAATVDRAQISGFDGAGVFLNRASGGAGPSVVQRSKVTGPGRDATYGAYGIFADDGSRFRAQSNDISATATGIFMDGLNPPGTELLGNRIDNTGRGIHLLRNTRRALIRGNRVTHNSATGIELNSSSNVTIDRNNASHNAAFGIYLLEGSGNLVQGNTMLGNGFLDCLDESSVFGPPSGTRWSGNTGRTQNKPRLCRPPQ